MCGRYGSRNRRSGSVSVRAAQRRAPFGDQSLRWRDIASAAATTEARGRRYGCWCPGLPSKPNSTAVRGQRAEQLARGRISPRRPAAAPASTPDGRPDTGRSVFGVAATSTGASVSQAESMVVAAGGTGRAPTAAGRNGPHPRRLPRTATLRRLRGSRAMTSARAGRRAMAR
jgi:hypothetical protein